MGLVHSYTHYSKMHWYSYMCIHVPIVWYFSVVSEYVIKRTKYELLVCFFRFLRARFGKNDYTKYLHNIKLVYDDDYYYIKMTRPQPLYSPCFSHSQQPQPCSDSENKFYRALLYFHVSQALGS